MSLFNYRAVDRRGREQHGRLEVEDQAEAVRRLREMGFLPTLVVDAASAPSGRESRGVAGARAMVGTSAARIGRWGRRVKPAALADFTRQLATLLAAGMPLLRGLRILEEQESAGTLKKTLVAVTAAIEGGGSLAEAMAEHPRVFNRLFINMVKAGEAGGVLDVVLTRLAEFMEKAEQIKGRVTAALYYPVAVLLLVGAILGLLMTFVVPRFQAIFDGLLNGRPMPPFTLMVLGVSQVVQRHWLLVLAMGAALVLCGRALVATRLGRWWLDWAKLRMPVLGPVFRKAAIARFTRTLGTLVGSGVPILQALTIVRETSGNVLVGAAVGAVHASVKQGETIAGPLRRSGIFPGMVVGMVDVGEQTGALPEMLGKIADNYDQEVDRAVGAMTSLLEPVLIVFLAVVVGSVVAALFLPLVAIMDDIDGSGGEQGT